MKDDATLLEPPLETPELKLGNWISLPGDNPIAAFLTETLWLESEPPAGWEVTRRSHAVYVYREVRTGWRAVAKFYVVKTGGSAKKHAQTELTLIQQARQASLSDGPVRAVRPYTTWRGVLFLEFVDGLTLEDVIAVRRSRPGTVNSALGSVAHLLARLHDKQAPDSAMDGTVDITAEARKMVHNLTRYGVLQNNPIIRDGLLRQIGRWPDNNVFRDYTITLVHGDATTTNFIFPDHSDALVAIDWERSGYKDPAADLGRIMAEIEHSITQHGGTLAEAGPLLQHLKQVYVKSASQTDDIETLIERARYHRAVTSLRIARNGWLSRLERTRLVAQALALLA